MPAQQIFTIASFTIKVGDNQTASRDITTLYQAGYTSYLIGIDMTGLPAQTFTLQCEFSPDNGVTWGWGASCTMIGGTPPYVKNGVTFFPNCGSVLPNTSWAANWPVNPATVLARATLTSPVNGKVQGGQIILS